MRLSKEQLGEIQGRYEKARIGVFDGRCVQLADIPKLLQALTEAYALLDKKDVALKFWNDVYVGCSCGPDFECHNCAVIRKIKKLSDSTHEGGEGVR